MSSRIVEDAFSLRKFIREAEAVSDEAMMACSKLKQMMLVARKNPEAGVDAGQRAMMRLMQAEQQALAMSTSLLRVHEELNKVAREYMGPNDMPETPVSASATAEAKQEDLIPG
jgi:hypothetical protein